MNTFTITLSNGRQFSGITMNGSMFVSKTEITADDLSREALKTVTIAETDGDKTTTSTLANAVCDAILHWPEGWLFNLRQMTQQEIERMELEMRLEEAEAALIELAAMIGGE